VKLILVLLVIPIGIVAFKKENKFMAVFALLLTLYIYGASESGSLTFSKAVASQENTIKVMQNVASTSTDDILRSGKEIYLAECKKCHGVDGKKGLFKSPDLSATKLNLSEKVAWIKQGKGVMPGYDGKLSDEEIKSVAAYLDELK
jgi:mono/diheme cytochrome c family protein